MVDPIPFPERKADERNAATAPEAGQTISVADLDWSEFHRVNDAEALANLREWARAAFESAGARCTGSGMGFGAVDIDIELQGHAYNVSLRPIKTAQGEQ